MQGLHCTTCCLDGHVAAACWYDRQLARLGTDVASKLDEETAHLLSVDLAAAKTAKE